MNTSNAYAPPKAAVADIRPESLGIELAGRGTRLLAAIIDGIIVVVITYAPLIISGDIRKSAEAALKSNDALAFYSGFLGVGGIVALAGLIIWAVITFRLVQQNGQTIAKKLLSIKVVRSDGSRASLSRIFWLRNVVNTLLSLVPFYSFVEILFIFGERRQCLHDKIADTIVVTA